MVVTNGQKLEHWLFLGLCSGEVFQALHGYNLAWGLQIDTRFECRKPV